ncbi:MAG: hypothetical protein B9S34_10890 [Opitutia bacterium Tous-C1TDCM]|nr:MAG: hypothetical protein B9S34_10890 [Opitutae bacterium Tous-C1TDCM]
MRRRFLIFALLLGAACYAAMHVSLRIAPAHENLGAKLEGRIAEGEGWYPGEPFATHRPVRAWGSWTGSDENTGALTVGPFPAPVRLRFAVGGYPPTPGISLRLERPGTTDTLPVEAPHVGERWRIIEVAVPPAWVSQPVRLVAVDDAKVLGGWFAVTEPIRGGVGDGATGLWQNLTAWLLNGFCLGVLWFAAMRLLAPRQLVPAPWLPLLGLAVVAAFAYLLFWLWFAGPRIGAAASFLGLAAGALLLLRSRAPDAAAAAEAAAVVRLTALVGLLYLGVLHLFPSSLDYYHLAANRFRAELPTDNELPHEVSARLVAGEPLRRADADWLSSDRPPLQSGWHLITWPVLTKLGLTPRAATGTASLWLQLAWVAAAYGLLRTLRLRPNRAAAWTGVIALSGFFLQNSTFTWPKLSAAALAAGAFGLWVLAPPDLDRRRAILVGAVLASLAWLSHGGVAFSYLVLAPWIAWRMLRGEAREWLLAALVFGLFAAPWIAYQKFYDPPGNRLLKWHLGGQIPKDERGTWQTIREGYAALSWPQIWAQKRQNLEIQVGGRWGALVETDPARALERRNEEFFLTGRAFTWWAFGFLLFPWVWNRLRPDRGADPQLGRMHCALLLWPLLTIPLWCALLFTGGQAVIHQGSYAAMLALFVVLSAWFDRAGRSWIFLIAALQTFTLATTWAPGNPVVFGDVSPAALAVVLLAGAGLAWQLLRRRDADGPPSDFVAARPEPPAAPESPPAAPGRWARATPWLAGLLALVPAAVCSRALGELWWFGDDWDLLDQIQRLGFWRWTLLPFAENFVPLFKVLWGGLVLAGGGYGVLISALWLTHALNTALLARLLVRTGFSFPAVGFTVVLFAVAAVNVETLAWSVQWSALLAVTCFLGAANILLPRLAAGDLRGFGLPLLLALLAAGSALTFARGVLTGGALAAVALLPLGLRTPAWPARLRVAAACLLPAVAVAVAIMLVSPGNHRALGDHGRAIAEFAFTYWTAVPLYRLLDSVTWHWPLLFALGALKAGLLVAGWRAARGCQRHVLALLLIFDLGNAVLLGVGRHHTGLPAANSERYYYNSLLCTLPFLGLAFAAWLRPLPAPRIRISLTAALIALAGFLAARHWPAAAEQFAAHRGRHTRDVLLRQQQPPAEGAVPGVPFLSTARAKELIRHYGLQ